MNLTSLKVSLSYPFPTLSRFSAFRCLLFLPSFCLKCQFTCISLTTLHNQYYYRNSKCDYLYGGLIVTPGKISPIGWPAECYQRKRGKIRRNIDAIERVEHRHRGAGMRQRVHIGRLWHITSLFQHSGHIRSARSPSSPNPCFPPPPLFLSKKTNARGLKRVKFSTWPEVWQHNRRSIKPCSA